MRKPYIIAFWLLALLVCSAFPGTAGTLDVPLVRLPTEYVTMRPVAGTNSTFDMTMGNITPGFDVVNGHYPGWCVQKDTAMRLNVNHTVLLYSSYDPNMPVDYRSDNWDKVNYVINHKQGDKQTIQDVIWYYTCNCTFPITPQDQLLINDTEEHGNGFVPSRGQTLAVVIEGIKKIQRTFFELQLPLNGSIGDLVWNDLNANGIQDSGEPGLPNVTVQLYSASNEIVATTVTDVHGYYSFSNFTYGNYSLQFMLPQGYKFSPEHQGTDDTKDSDADPLTGRTVVTTFDPANLDMGWDAGMYVPSSQGGPGGSGSTPNHAPTADGSAGQPYKGFVGEEIIFDGSRSYDLDGTIVSYAWSFGDGTTGTGKSVMHAYTTAGTFPVTLTVTDNDGATDTYTTTATIRGPDQPPLPPQINGPRDGHQNTSYTYSFLTTDPDNDTVQYTVVWGDGSQNTSSFYHSGHTIHLAHQWDSYGFYYINASAQDPSNATSNISHVRVSIDVQYVGSLGYLINSDGTGPFDLFYSNQTGNITRVQVQSNGDYLIDTNGDGTFDMSYNSQSGALQAYSNTLGPVYTMLLVGVVIVILLIVLIAFIMNRIRKT